MKAIYDQSDEQVGGPMRNGTKPRHRGAVCRGFVLLMLALLLFPTSSSAVSVGAREKGMAVAINAFRVSKGRAPLRLEYSLTAAAEWMSRDMVGRRYLSHTDSLGRSPFTRMRVFGYPSDTRRGENIGRQGTCSNRAILAAWLASPGHRANLLTREFRAIGISRTQTVLGRWDCYWVTDFGSRVVRPVYYTPR